MAEPFLSEIRIMSFDFPPKGWARCDGQLLPVTQNKAMFALLGTTYGGDGQTTFALPDLRGRVPVHQTADFPLGNRGGQQSHTLTISELPQHSHTLDASAAPANANPPSPSGNVLADSRPASAYRPPTYPAAMNSGTVANAGGSQGHPNMQPFMALNFCIALQGSFPAQS